MLSAWYSTTLAQTTHHRARHLMRTTSTPKQSPALSTAQLRTAVCLLSSCAPYTNLRPSLLCSTWHALPSTDTQTAPTSCHSQTCSCTTCRTTLSTYEGHRLCGAGHPNPDRNMGQGEYWDNMRSQATDSGPKGHHCNYLIYLGVTSLLINELSLSI